MRNSTLTTAVIVIIGWLVIGLLPNPIGLSVLSGRSEHIEWVVANPELSRFDGRGFQIYGSAEGMPQLTDGSCIAGIVEPAMRATVTYMVIDRSIIVEIAPPGTAGGKSVQANMAGPTAHIQLADGSLRPVRGAIQLVSAPPQRRQACGPVRTHRLPVWGPGTIGEPLRFGADGPSLSLIEIEVDLYGRSLDWLNLLSDRRLYPALQRPIRIPAGSRLTTLIEPDGSRLTTPDDADLRAFRGFVRTLDPTGMEFTLHLSTEARELWFYSPGTGPLPERLTMDVFAEFFGDPGTARLQIALLAFVILLPIVMEVLFVLRLHRNEVLGPDPDEVATPSSSEDNLQAPQPAKSQKEPEP